MAQSRNQSVVTADTTMNPLLQQLLTASQNRDASIERIAADVKHIASDTSRKLDEAERDTRKQFESFSANIANQFQSVTTKFESALATRDAKLESVSAEFLKSRQAPWMQLIALGGLLITFGGAIGWMAYSPVLDRVDRTEAAIDKVAGTQSAMQNFITSSFVSKGELDTRAERGKEDRDRTQRAIEDLRANVFPREVHQKQWDKIDSDIGATNQRLLEQGNNLQREIDLLQKNLGDTFTARDALLENKDRISKLEEMVRDLIGRSTRTMP